MNFIKQIDYLYKKRMIYLGLFIILLSAGDVFSSSLEEDKESLRIPYDGGSCLTERDTTSDSVSDLTHVSPKALWQVISGENGLVAVQRYLESGGNPNLEDCKQRRLLDMVACLKGPLAESLIRTLVKKGAVIDYYDPKGHSAIYVASAKGNAAILEVLLTSFYDRDAVDQCHVCVNHADTRKITPLLIAISKGHEESVRLLLKYGAEINQVDDRGWSSLHMASYWGYAPIISLLLAYEADVFQESLAGFSARPYAISQKKGNPEKYAPIIRLLQSAELSEQDKRKHEDIAEKKRIKQHKQLGRFYETFNEKLEEMFLAYKVLNSGCVVMNKDTFCPSNCINLVGNLIPLPGASTVASIASAVADFVEQRIEEPKIQFLAMVFSNMREMSDTLEKSSYDVTCYYEPILCLLTETGVKQLAECGVGRFIAYMRANHVKAAREKNFSSQVFEGLQTFDARMGWLPWQDVEIETEEGQQWKDRLIFKDHITLLFSKESEKDHQNDEVRASSSAFVSLSIVNETHRQTTVRRNGSLTVVSTAGSRNCGIGCSIQ